MRFLLDANVLIAIGFPSHAAHRKCHEWLRGEPSRLWATCPPTQAAALRHVTRLLGGTHKSFHIALAGLEEDCRNPNHEYWPVDVDLRELADAMRARILGPNQITNLQLLVLAHKHHGKLATLDNSILELARGTRYANSLHLI